jgi:hypothetical protein
MSPTGKDKEGIIHSLIEVLPELFLEGGRNPRQTSEYFVSWWPRSEKEV